MNSVSLIKYEIISNKITFFFISEKKTISKKEKKNMPFVKRNKRLEISSPTNFEHRVHSGFDHNHGVFVGLPSQWNSIINETEQTKHMANFNQLQNINDENTKKNNTNIDAANTLSSLNNIMNNRSTYRPKPIVDPSHITPTELTCFKVY
jgi:hypothetical protein